MAFGPAFPGLQDRLMGGSDVVIGGFRNDGDSVRGFAKDYFIGGKQGIDSMVISPTTFEIYDLLLIALQDMTSAPS